MSARWFPDAMPMPAVNEDTRPFFHACLQHRLAIQRCTSCGRHRHPPRPVCPWCHSFEADWPNTDGTGTLFTYSVVHLPFLPALSPSVPYVVAVVELDGTGGTRMTSNLVDVAEDRIAIGMPVTVVWEDMGPSLTLPRFTARS
jgi:uncharacterized OB-fold protein